MNKNIHLRPITDSDHDFLRHLYGTTRADELAFAGWGEREKDAFIAFQFRAQQTHYSCQYPGAAFDLLLVEGEPIGCLYVDRRDEETEVINIALLPEWRCKGIGGRLLSGILDEGKRVLLGVAVNNPRATAFYHRLGFRRTGADEMHLRMEWEPKR